MRHRWSLFIVLFFPTLVGAEDTRSIDFARQIRELTGEEFTPAQLFPRNPRSAVGQTADGRILLVAVDGRAHSENVSAGDRRHSQRRERRSRTP